MFCGADGLWFNFRYTCSKVLLFNTQVSSKANGINQSLQFINFQRRAAEMKWGLGLLSERGVTERGIKGGSLTDSNTRTKGPCRDAPLCCWSTVRRWETIHSSLDEKLSLLMGLDQTRAHVQQSWLSTVFVPLSLLHFKAAPSLKGHAMLALHTPLEPSALIG